MARVREGTSDDLTDEKYPEHNYYWRVAEERQVQSRQPAWAQEPQ
jgi:hypothetical protein